MSGLIVLVPYTGGQDFYQEYEDDNQDYEEDDEDEEETELSSEDELIAYLPVYVETEETNLALMAVAYEACVKYSYVGSPSSDITIQEWEDKDFPGSLEAPGIELPSTEEAFEIPEPGDCFCCGSLSDYEVITLKEMLEQLKADPARFIPTFLDDDESLWQQFDDWSVRLLNYHLFTKK
jgi:hypothetical protein